MSSESHDIKPMIDTYKKLFAVLSVITIIGILIAVLHLPVWFIIIVGLVFIAIKGAVVYESFKKLLVGRSLIVLVFLLTLLLVIGLLFGPVMNHGSYIVGTEDISKELMMEQTPAEGHGEAKEAKVTKEEHHGN